MILADGQYNPISSRARIRAAPFRSRWAGIIGRLLNTDFQQLSGGFPPHARFIIKESDALAVVE
jgi:hypothetical protein